MDALKRQRNWSAWKCLFGLVGTGVCVRYGPVLALAPSMLAFMYGASHPPSGVTEQAQHSKAARILLFGTPLTAGIAVVAMCGFARLAWRSGQTAYVLQRQIREQEIIAVMKKEIKK